MPWSSWKSAIWSRTHPSRSGVARERPGELGGRRRRRRPRQAAQPRRDGPGEHLLVADQRVRAEPVDRGVDAGQHRVPERDREVLPVGSERGGAAQPQPSGAGLAQVRGERVVARRINARTGAQQRFEGGAVARPGDLVAAPGEAAATATVGTTWRATGGTANRNRRLGVSARMPCSPRMDGTWTRRARRALIGRLPSGARGSGGTT
ncbi:hypothetical protein [Actinomadura sp. CNU-125]|uniref:hypothetical protein n=1 Tax=Actinomadura sp. CNU-125 TaxID=1904961 RepID=UPI0021CD01E6|nr:hypothetical protein [Actinomadura sp. CNU-125]